MKDIKEFQKLFKVNFPVVEHHQYYIDTLMKSPFYAGLGKVVTDFELLEEYIDLHERSSVKSYKMKCLDRMAEYLKKTEAYEKLQSRDFSEYNFRTKDELKNNDNTYLVSIDFKAANYNALKTYDTNGDLSTSWEELCGELRVHRVLASSKSFRQIVFGNTNPKRLQRTQHINILKIVDKLKENHGFEEDDFVFISHDEFIVRLRPDQKLAVNRILLLNSAVGQIIEEEGINMPTHYKVLKNEKISGQMRLQTHYQVKMGGLSEKYDTLFKVPGNKFFKYFKKLILKEPLDQRDLMFMNDGEVAIWAEGEDSIAEQYAPEGEMTYEEIKEEYPYLVEKLRSDVPGLNDSQRRKIINIFMNTCHHCYEQEKPCHCWNDE